MVQGERHMSKIMNHLMIATIACFIGASSYAVAHEGDGKLGNVSFPISCKGEQAKFDRAITLMHNFFYPETSKAFQEIIRDDPDCGIAYWGLATSYRPNPLVPPFPVAIFYALSLLEMIDLSDKTYGNQLKAARIRNAQAKDHPKHPGSPII